MADLEIVLETDLNHEFGDNSVEFTAPIRDPFITLGIRQRYEVIHCNRCQFAEQSESDTLDHIVVQLYVESDLMSDFHFSSM